MLEGGHEEANQSGAAGADHPAIRREQVAVDEVVVEGALPEGEGGGAVDQAEGAGGGAAVDGGEEGLGDCGAAGDERELDPLGEGRELAREHGGVVFVRFDPGEVAFAERLEIGGLGELGA